MRQLERNYVDVLSEIDDAIDALLTKNAVAALQMLKEEEKIGEIRSCLNDALTRIIEEVSDDESFTVRYKDDEKRSRMHVRVHVWSDEINVHIVAESRDMESKKDIMLKLVVDNEEVDENA